MSTEQAITLADLERLTDAEAPDLAAAITAFLEQPEPEPTEPLPDDAINLKALRAALYQASKRHDKKRRSSEAHEVWKRYLAQPVSQIAPQMGIAELVVKLYERKTPAARAALLLLSAEAPLMFGLWGGLKRVFKRAEKDFDAEVFATLAVRFDLATGGENRRDVGRGTLVYLRRRAARVLRLLGKASLELYPTFAVEVLRRYPLNATPATSEIAASIIRSSSKKWGAPIGLAKGKNFRAPYLEAWKLSPEPLMLLLETCQSDMAASFAILGLRELHPEMFRNLSIEWLARLAYRPLPSAHDFLVEVLEGSPQLHQGNIASLGLKDAVLRLLLSPSAKARKYAIDYARGHATDLPTEQLVDLLDTASSYRDTTVFVAGLLKARRPARSLGLVVLGRLLRFDVTRSFAATALETEFDKQEITQDFLLDVLFDASDTSRTWARKFIDGLEPTQLPVSFWLRLLDDPRLVERPYDGNDRFACGKLKKYPLASVPGDWLLAALGRTDIGSNIAALLEKADALPPSLDLEQIRGLVFDPSKRQVAFTILGNPKIVAPHEVGIGWLLALARRADPSLHEWAHRYLLTNVKPELFSDGKPSLSAGVARLFALASGTKEPDAIRAFAQLYLCVHHPKLGRREAESKQYGIKPRIPGEEYSEERVWPCLFDLRADVRRFGVSIARVEMRRWNAAPRIYELAESPAKEVRNVAYDALFQAGESDADPELALHVDELDAAQIFSMTESRRRPTRDAGMDLIRKHYVRLGGAERLAWLMQSADREVRLFAVRLLWERHRPRGLPAGWRPPEGKTLPRGDSFDDAEVLRSLLRRMLFMVPPARSAEAADQVRAKKLSASIAKRHVIEVVRDLGVADVEFAQVVAPVLGEFTGSVAKGEWQACLAALMRLRAVHGLAIEGLV